MLPLVASPSLATGGFLKGETMCIDLKNNTKSHSQSFGLNVALTAVGIVLAVALWAWCVALLPAALDQSLGISVQQQTPGKVWTFVGADR